MLMEMNNISVTHKGGGPGNSNDYTYHKIFVGGLHYDTRDGMKYTFIFFFI